jgi:hypothetical protein
MQDDWPGRDINTRPFVNRNAGYTLHIEEGILK